MKVGDTVTIAVGEPFDRHLRIAHVTVVSAGFIGAATTSYRRGRRISSWSGSLRLSDEGLRWLRGSHARKGKPVTAAGRALATAYSLSTTGAS